MYENHTTLVRHLAGQMKVHGIRPDIEVSIFRTSTGRAGLLTKG